MRRAREECEHAARFDWTLCVPQKRVHADGHVSIRGTRPLTGPKVAAVRSQQACRPMAAGARHGAGAEAVGPEGARLSPTGQRGDCAAAGAAVLQHEGAGAAGPRVAGCRALVVAASQPAVAGLQACRQEMGSGRVALGAGGPSSEPSHEHRHIHDAYMMCSKTHVPCAHLLTGRAALPITAAPLTGVAPTEA